MKYFIDKSLFMKCRAVPAVVPQAGGVSPVAKTTVLKPTGKNIQDMTILLQHLSLCVTHPAAHIYRAVKALQTM